MSKFTVEQVEAAIAEYEEETLNEKYGFMDSRDFFDDVRWDYGTDPVILPGLGEVKRVAAEGGSEGDGDYMDVVFQLGDQYFRKTGFHNSWDSNEWDGALVEVEPYERTVVGYRAV